MRLTLRLNSTCALAAAGLVGFASAPASMQNGPTVQGVSGPLSHGQTITVTGKSFGTKPTAAPLAWDDASGANLRATWDGAWPSSGTEAYRTQYRAAPYRNVPAPHGRTGRYIVGAHGDDAGFDAGYNVMLWKRRDVTLPAITYLSYYYRVDPKWDCGSDNNHKLYDWSSGTSPYDSQNWYVEYNPSDFCTGDPAWHLNDNRAGLGGGPNAWWGDAACNPRRQWCKIEHEILHAASGVVRITDQGRVTLHMKNVQTDGIKGTARVDGIGGFSSNSGNPANHRYFADVYLDSSLARAVLGDKPKYDSSRLREVQIPTSWAPASVTLRVNAGAFANGASAWLYVIDANGLVSPGFPVTVGSAQTSASGK